MKREFIPYDLALKLKELGFNEPCLAYYDEKLYYPYNDNIYGKFCNQPKDVASCSAPLYQQAFRWFREKYGLHNHVELFSDGAFELFTYSIRYGDNLVEDDYGIYEEAELACLKKLIEIAKNK